MCELSDAEGVGFVIVTPRRGAARSGAPCGEAGGRPGSVSRAAASRAAGALRFGGLVDRPALRAHPAPRVRCLHHPGVHGRADPGRAGADGGGERHERVRRGAAPADTRHRAPRDGRGPGRRRLRGRSAGGTAPGPVGVQLLRRRRHGDGRGGGEPGERLRRRPERARGPDDDRIGHALRHPGRHARRAQGPADGRAPGDPSRAAARRQRHPGAEPARRGRRHAAAAAVSARRRVRGGRRTGLHPGGGAHGGAGGTRARQPGPGRRPGDPRRPAHRGRRRGFAGPRAPGLAGVELGGPVRRPVSGGPAGEADDVPDPADGRRRRRIQHRFPASPWR